MSYLITNPEDRFSRDMAQIHVGNPVFCNSLIRRHVIIAKEKKAWQIAVYYTIKDKKSMDRLH